MKKREYDINVKKLLEENPRGRSLVRKNGQIVLRGNYDTRHMYNLRELFRFIDTRWLKIYYTFYKKKHTDLGISIVTDLLKLIILDVVNKSYRFESGFQGGKFQIGIFPLSKDVVERKRKNGIFPRIDLLASDFNIFTIELKITAKKRTLTRNLRVSNYIYDKIIEKTNKGYKFPPRAFVSYKHYIDKLSIIYPDITKEDFIKLIKKFFTRWMSEIIKGNDTNFSNSHPGFLNIKVCKYNLSISRANLRSLFLQKVKKMRLKPVEECTKSIRTFIIEDYYDENIKERNRLFKEVRDKDYMDVNTLPIKVIYDPLENNNN